MAKNMFSLEGKVAAIPGGGGVLGATIGQGLAEAGATVAFGDLFEDKAQEAAQAVKDGGGEARAYKVDVLDRESLAGFAASVTDDFGKVDILVSAGGGNQKGATTSDDQNFFELSEEALRKVVDLNLYGGAVFPAMEFAPKMLDNPDGGSIVNISSMAAIRPLTRTIGYSAAKAAVSNFTWWLSVHLAQEYGPGIRVNALAPGFFLTEQNRFLLLKDGKEGQMTPRGQAIIDHTPLGRYGDPKELIGGTIWLASEASSFVTGIVLPIDGGFSAYCGV